MNAAGMILSAGEGTRLRPLTSLIPKPLVTVAGVPVFEVAAEKLIREGASVIHANLFHLGEAIEEFAASRDWPVVFHREQQLLGTGGGIGNMAAGLEGFDVIFLSNSDIVSNAGFHEAASFHLEHKALFTMILAESGHSVPERTAPPPSVTLGDDFRVISIGRNGKGGKEPEFGYTGMAVISPEAFRFFPEGEKAGLVGILDAMIIAVPGSVAGFPASRGEGKFAWAETGTPGALVSVHERILVGRELFDPALAPPPLPLRFSKNAEVDPGAEWKGFLDVGEGSAIEKDTYLENCVVMPGTRVTSGTRVKNAVLFRDGILEAR